MMPVDPQAQKDVKDLREEAADLTSVVAELAKRFDIASQQVRLLRRMAATLTGIIVVLVISGLVIGTLLFKQVSRNNEFLSQGTSARAAIFEIDDCIRPDGKCHKRQQAQTNDILKKIIDGNGNGKVDTQEILDELKKLQTGGR
jgi:hypothetical protein